MLQPDLDGFAPPWVREPYGRGTWKILDKCLQTIILSAWVPLYLNILAPKLLLLAKVRRFIFWSLFAFVIPEWVLYIAAVEWLRMKKFLEKMYSEEIELHEKQLRGISDPIYGDFKIQKFDQRKLYPHSYGWVASMGFFTIRIDGLQNVAANCRLSLSVNGILELAKLGILLRVKNSEIPHNTLADIIAKVLPLLQALSFFYTIVSRLAAHLPFALLEIETLINLVCGIPRYILWFRKPANLETTKNWDVEPLDRVVPKILSGTIKPKEYIFTMSRSEKIYAVAKLDPRDNNEHLLCPICTPGWHGSKQIISSGETDPKLSTIYLLEGRPHGNMTLQSTVTNVEEGARLVDLPPVAQLHGQISELESIESPATQFPCLTCVPWDESSQSSKPHTFGWQRPSPQTMPIHIMVELQDSFLKPTIYNFSFLRLEFTRDRKGRCTGNVKVHVEDVNLDIALAYLGILLYALVHLLIYVTRDVFPTVIEGKLYAAAVYGIMGWLFFALLLEVSTTIYSRFTAGRWRVYNWRNPGVRTVEVSMWQFLPAATLCTLVMAGRLYFLAEAFASLRHERVEVFHTPGLGWCRS